MKTILNIIAVFILVVLFSCTKLLPKERNSLDPNARFTSSIFTPTLGRPALFSNFNVATSTQPLSFKILNIRTKSGLPAPELTDVFPVTVWKGNYTGDERTLKEIEDKRAIENHHLFEVRPQSGQFVMWPEAANYNLRAQPDSGYAFDVEVSNTGGTKYYKELRLKPFRARPYEPNNFNQLTGQPTDGVMHPSSMRNIFGESDNSLLGTNDVIVLFRKMGNGNSLSFQFWDTLQNPIDPKKFALTKWPILVHGFDMQMSNDAVTYKAAYPIPLITLPTKYTNQSGSRAHTVFSWSRIGFSNFTLIASLEFDFSIFEKGDWQIIFWFKNDNPKFEDE